MEHREYAYLLKDVFGNFEYGYKQEDLWELAKKKKVHLIPIVHVRHWVYKQCWSDDNDAFISPYQVMLQPKLFKNHKKRIDKANLDYPIIIINDDYDIAGTILDGNHRFIKALLTGKEYIKVVKITDNELSHLKIKM